MANYAFRVDGSRLNIKINYQHDGTQNQTRLREEVRGPFLLELPRYNDPDNAIPGGIYKLEVYPGSTGSAHRIMVKCKCERDIPSGRMHQHAATCSALQALPGALFEPSSDEILRGW